MGWPMLRMTAAARGQREETDDGARRKFYTEQLTELADADAPTAITIKDGESVFVLRNLQRGRSDKWSDAISAGNTNAANLRVGKFIGSHGECGMTNSPRGKGTCSNRVIELWLDVRSKGRGRLRAIPASIDT